MPTNNNKILLCVSFLEGGALMAYEVISSRIVAPHFGSTIFVWTSILTVTLLGLALGYRNGDKIKKEQGLNRLFISLIVSAGFIMSAKLLSNLLFPFFYDVDLRISSFLGAFILLLVPMYLLGTVSPLIIQQLSSDETVVAQNSGLVYGISTLAGVFVAMLVVFFVVPVSGIQVSLLVISLLPLLAAMSLKWIK